MKNIIVLDSYLKFIDQRMMNANHSSLLALTNKMDLPKVEFDVLRFEVA